MNAYFSLVHMYVQPLIVMLCVLLYLKLFAAFLLFFVHIPVFLHHSYDTILLFSVHTPALLYHLVEVYLLSYVHILVFVHLILEAIQKFDVYIPVLSHNIHLFLHFVVLLFDITVLSVQFVLYFALNSFQSFLFVL